MTFATALRLMPRGHNLRANDGNPGICVAFVGAGGKTTSIFALAHELPVPTLVTSTTHIGAWQLDQADKHVVANTPADLVGLGERKLTLVTGPPGVDHRMSSVTPEVLGRLRRESLTHGWPLLIEADGARQRPLKAPRADEPQLPQFVEVVVVVAGMGGLHRRLDGDSVHRPEIYAQLSGLSLGSTVTADAIGRVLSYARGGLKDIPSRARRVALLNQADTPELQAEARSIAHSLRNHYDSIVTATMRLNAVRAVHEPCAGIVLAAGGATRFGRPKQLLAWHGQPLVRVVANTALDAGLSPVIIVAGAESLQVEAAVAGLPVIAARNERWQDGQASSIRTGLDACPTSAGSAIFLLADQPRVTPDVIRALVAAHASESATIVAPMLQGDRRGNPVLFDRETFAHLRELRGDVGGRVIFSHYPIHYLPWHDDHIALDIDTEDDYGALLEDDRA